MSLRVVPSREGRPRRLLGIVRVSKKRDDMTSPELQEHKIRAMVNSLGDELAPAPDGQDFLYGIDESGSQRRSKWWRKLDQAIELVEAGEYDGVVMWKFSRAGRNRLRWNLAVDRIEAAGGVLLSATEDFDVSTAAGRLGRGISAEFNAFQADMIGESWTETHERRVRAGLPHSGRRHFGYAYDREAKLHKPHPAEGPVLAEAYHRYIAGESVYELVRWLNADGWRTSADGPWSDRTLRRVLDDGFASGRFTFRGQLHDGVHEPLIDPVTWQAYLDARSARRALPARVERSQYLLSGLVRCARCGGAMVANASDPGTRLSQRAKGRAEGKRYSAGKPRLTFRCARGKESGTCRGGYISMRLVEAEVMAYLQGLADEIDEATTTTEGGRVLDARRRLLVREEDRLQDELARVDAALVQLALRDAERPMPAAAYAAARNELEGRAAWLRDAIEVAGRSHRRSAVDPPKVAADLLGAWDETLVTTRREVLRGLIDCVLVRTGGDGERWLRVVPWEDARG